jgi:hypothetical protein
MGRHRMSRAALLAVPLAAALVLTLFAWPTARLEPRGLPVGVAGPAAGVAAAEQRLEAADGSFELHRYPDEAAAREAIADREVYGAFVATGGGTVTLTASAASPSVATLIAEAGGGRAVDVVPGSEHDPRGAGLAAATLPLVMAGMLAAAAATFLPRPGIRRAGLAAASAGGVGLAATAIVQGWLGVVEGDWTANWAAFSLTVLAIAWAAAGLAALIGRAGLAMAGALMIVLGNAFSAMSSAPELLPEPAGAIGRLMPSGAGGNLVRSTGFFDGAGAGDHLIVLAAWSLLGLAALVAAGPRERARLGAAGNDPVSSPHDGARRPAARTVRDHA